VAYINGTKEDDLLNQNGDQTQTPELSQQTQLIGGDSQAVGNNITQQGSGGAAGNKGWTNIQAYLGANQGDQGSAQALNKQVGDQFGKEKQSYTEDAQKVQADAQKQVADSKVSNADADNAIKNSADQYSWGGNQSSDYAAGVQKMQNALNQQYAGPTSYNYAFNPTTQNYGNQLKDNTGFDALMNNVYSNAAGKNLSSGQFNLQKQLDVNNQNLVDTRKNLANQYDQLVSDRDKTIQDTTSSLGQAEQDYRTNQNALRDYLSGQLNAYDTKGKQAEIDARAAYNKDYTTGIAGVGSYDQALRNGLSGFSTVMGSTYGDNGQAGQNWQDVQNILNNPNTFRLADGAIVGSRIANAQAMANDRAWRDNALATLNNYYQGADQQYANTGDTEKRSYNAIADYLGLTDPRKQQGFSVRG
jgi:hypothetical protein